MWDVDGMWRPEITDRREISAQPTDEEKIQFIEDLFNTILKLSNSRANYSDLRMELVDHYVAELGEDFSITDGEVFKKRVYDYHEKFGGPKRISQVTKNFYKNKQKLIQLQFRRWYMEYWPIHLLFIPIGFMISYSVDVKAQTVVMLILVMVLVIVEGYKYYRDRHLRRRIQEGHSTINFFYQYKLQFLLLLTLPFNFLGVLDLVEAKWLCALIFPFVYYICGWGYYYHINVCQRRVAPLLEEYRSQLLSQTKIA